MEDKIINIEMAQGAVGKSGESIRTSGVGSCVVITIYDPVNKIGGMAHAMLPIFPINTANPDTKVLLKYADSAIKELVRQMNARGGKQSYYKAKLVGGAKMFKILGNDNNAIGIKNVEAAKNTLNEMRLTLESEDTGGTVGRTVLFEIHSGIVSVSTKM